MIQAGESAPDFELETERPVVEVRAPDGRYRVVDQDDLLMHEAFVVAIELDPESVELLDVPQRRQIDDRVVGLFGHDDAHVDASERRQPQGGHDRRVGHEVRSRDPDPVAGGVGGVDEEQLRLLQPLDR